MPNGDTKVPLRDYLEHQIQAVGNKVEASERVVLSKLDAMEVATTLSRENLEQRLDAMNEWRQQSKDREREFLSRAEYAAYHDRVVDDVRSLRESRAEISGKASQKSVNITQGIALAALAGTLINVALRLAGR